MNKQPIEQAHDADLRLSKVALQRAARQAHELARKTGTSVVVSRSGIVEYLSPQAVPPGQRVQESAPPYIDKK